MLTFAIGFFMLLGLVLLFNMMQTTVLSDIRTPQAMEVLNYVAAASESIMKINASSSYIIITPPKKIGDSTYTIKGSISGDRIVLESPEISENISSPTFFKGEFDSNYEHAMLLYDGGNITIKGVYY